MVDNYMILHDRLSSSTPHHEKEDGTAYQDVFEISTRSGLRRLLTSNVHIMIEGEKTQWMKDLVGGIVSLNSIPWHTTKVDTPCVNLLFKREAMVTSAIDSFSLCYEIHIV